MSASRRPMSNGKVALIVLGIAFGFSLLLVLVVESIGWMFMLWAMIIVSGILAVVLFIRARKLRRPKDTGHELPKLEDMEVYKDLARRMVMHDEDNPDMFTIEEVNNLKEGAVGVDPSPIVHVRGWRMYDRKRGDIIFNLLDMARPTHLIDKTEEEVQEKIKKIASNPEKMEVTRMTRVLPDGSEMVTETSKQSVSQIQKEEEQRKKEEEEAI